MNIFYDYEGILGKPQQAHLRNTLEEILKLARAIRNQLGKQGYLLDKYLHDLLTSLNSKLAYDAADSGFQITGELLHLCNKLTRGEPVEKEHPLYEPGKGVYRRPSAALSGACNQGKPLLYRSRGYLSRLCDSRVY